MQTTEFVVKRLCSEKKNRSWPRDLVEDPYVYMVELVIVNTIVGENEHHGRETIFLYLR